MAHYESYADAGAKLYRRFLDTGDEAAFEELVALYRASLASYINGFVNDRHEADELALDAFAELALAANFKGQSSLKTYLFSIGRHLALRHVKQYRYNTHVPLDEIMDDITPGTEENPTETDYLRKKQKEQLHAAMQALKPDYREALYLIYFEDMSYADAGKTMGKTQKQVRNLLYTAKASLKKMLTSGEDRS